MEHEIIQFSGILSALFIGLLIGLRLSTDGDHIVAISTIVRDIKKIKQILGDGKKRIWDSELPAKEKLRKF